MPPREISTEFDVRRYVDVISSTSSQRDINDMLSKKKARLRRLGRLFIYRDVGMVNEYILPDLRDGKIPETKMTVPGVSFVHSDKYPSIDENDCRIPLELFYRRFSRQDLLSLLSDTLFSQEKTKRNAWFLECLKVNDEEKNDLWAEKIVNITSIYFPLLNTEEHNKIRKFLENPWLVFQENERMGVVLRSFSEDKDSQYMWKNYAKGSDGCGGKGICIEYDTWQFIQNSVIMQYIHPVLYSDSDDDTLIPELRSGGELTISDGDFNNQRIRSFLTKGTRFENEHEWRYIYIPPYRSTNIDLYNAGRLQEISRNNNIDYLPFTPCCIYLGPNRDEDFAISVKNSVELFNRNTRTHVQLDVNDTLFQDSSEIHES